ncbi:hypothetical protein GNP63_14255 [Aliivibrio fischeri]|uniref:RHS repeat domain-containing protein n=1 Tax=Aliivibrio fischeri TaxID=668 RepID=UPI0012D97D77|nr:hypothetical protein [Aliivibrio fischeri]MUH97696.1 hypothetical protein [Aliivibrio fischeri]MUI62401.1 hypothetical protein [Aliivibrio fischeri]
MIPENSTVKNFNSYINGEIDPRTGSYTLMYELFSLANPMFSLKMIYNSNNKSDDIGFGSGFSLMLTNISFDRDGSPKLINLDDGRTFHVDRYNYNLINHYCDDIKIDLYNRKWRVRYINGNTDILNFDTGCIESRTYLDGNVINFIWKKVFGSNRLIGVNNNLGAQLTISYIRDCTETKLIYDNIIQKTTKYNLTSLNSVKVLNNIESGNNVLYITFKYIEGNLLLSEFQNEYRLKTIINYIGKTAVPIDYPVKKIFLVSRLTYKDLNENKERTISYDYGSNNYTGYGGISRYDLTTIFDPVAKYASKEFEYETTETLYVTSDTHFSLQRKYNKYHFLIEENYFCYKNNIPEIYLKKFHSYYSDFDCDIELQPKNFGKIKEYEIQYHNNDNIRVEIESFIYNNWGGEIEKTFSNGFYKQTEYYLPEGEDLSTEFGCPASPNGMAMFVKKVSNFDKDKKVFESEAYKYGLIKNRSIALFETNTLSKKVLYEYYDDETDAFIFGRIKQEKIKIGEITNETVFYTYDRHNSEYGTIRTVAGENGNYKDYFKRNAYDNRLLSEKINDGFEFNYQYDTNNRVTRKTIYTEDKQFSYEDFVYNFSEETSIEITDNEKFLQKINKYNSYGYIYEEWLYFGGEYILIASYEYDDFMNLTTKIAYDEYDRGDIEEVYIYEYDNYQNLSKIIYPTLKEEIINNDLLERTVTTSSGNKKIKVTMDELGRVIEKNRYVGDSDSTGSKEIFEYNIFGKTSLSNNERLTTKYSYDEYLRITSLETESLLSNNEEKIVTNYTYKDNSFLESPVSILIDNVIIGSRTYDSLNRLSMEVTQGYIKSYKYDKGSSRVTNLNDSIDYVYENIDYIISEKSLNVSNTFTYSNGNLKTASNSTVEYTYSYDNQHRISSMLVDCVTLGYQIKYLYKYSLLGKLVSIDAMNNSDEVKKYSDVYDYSVIGQLSSINVVTKDCLLEYNNNNQITKINVNNDNIKVVIEYDDLEREISRTLNVKNNKPISINYTYDKFDRVINMVISIFDSLENVSYEYNANNQLVRYISNTTLGLSTETYAYDKYQNITVVNSTYQRHSYFETINKEFIYDNVHVQKLLSVNTTINNISDTTNITYDSNGNIISDKSNDYVYNELNQMTMSISKDGIENNISYFYDANKQLSLKSYSDKYELYIYEDDEAIRDIITFDNQHNVKIETHYTYFGNGIVKYRSQYTEVGVDDEVKYLFVDKKGTPIVEIDSDLNIQAIPMYSPYGCI